MTKAPLSKIVQIISGGTPKTSAREYWDNGTIGWLSVADFNNDLRYVYDTEKKITETGLKNSNTKLLQKGDVIISARGTVGALAQIGTPMAFNQSCFGLRGNDGVVDNNFLYYCLSNYVSNIKKRSQGSVFDTINLNSFDLMEIEIPTLQDQLKIAEVLSSLDSKIELNNKINGQLEAQAKALYAYWFVQFDFPNAKGMPYKTSGGKMMWSEELKKEIPEGWEVKKINSIIKIGSGYPFSSETYTQNGIHKIITIKNVQDGQLDTTNVERIDEIPDKVSDFCRLEYGDVLISLTGNVGRMCFVSEDGLLLNQRVGKLIADKKYVNFGYLFFSRQEQQIRLLNIASGSSQANLSPVDVTKDLMCIPSPDVIDNFSKLINPVFTLIVNNSNENKRLCELRDWLLPMLMNGQVKVK